MSKTALQAILCVAVATTYLLLRSVSVFEKGVYCPISVSNNIQISLYGGNIRFGFDS